MTRRIAGTFFALLTALLVLAVVPLGITKSESQHDSFRFDTDSAARVVASDAEQVLSTRQPASALREGLDVASSAGDCAAVYNAGAGLLAKTKCTRASGATARALVARVRAGGRAQDPDADLTAQDGQWLLVGVPVANDDDAAAAKNGDITGFVVYARNGDPMDDRINAMWGWLLLTTGGCLALAAFLSVRLARWVSRPLGGLGDAAARLGEGELGVRADIDDGPEQVRKLAETFNWMAERIETLVHGHRAWIADVSHQLRTPLTALRLRLDLLGADASDEHTTAELAGAQEEIARLSRLVDGLLAIARTESAVPRRVPVRADRIARERVAAWAPVAAEKGVELTIAAAEPVTIALGDGDLEQILDNLVANAIEAVGEQGDEAGAGQEPRGSRGKVCIHVVDTMDRDRDRDRDRERDRDRDRHRATVRVTDDGPGMSDERKAAAFHRYGQARSRGNGLGLAIVHRLTTANGGRAALRDTPGGGLTVELDWPQGPPPSAQPERTASQHAASVQARPTPPAPAPPPPNASPGAHPTCP